MFNGGRRGSQSRLIELAQKNARNQDDALTRVKSRPKLTKLPVLTIVTDGLFRSALIVLTESFTSPSAEDSEKECNFVMSSFLSSTYIRLLGRLASVAIIAMSTNASAGIIVDIAEDGDDLVVNVSGSFDYGTFIDFTDPGTTTGLVGQGPTSNIYQYIVSNDLQRIGIANGVLDGSNWSSLFFKGSSQVLALTDVVGETFGGWRADPQGLIMPNGYVSGTVWESSARIVGPIGVKPASGSYATFTLNETGDTFTMRYNSSFTPGAGATVPEPSTAIVMGLLGIVGFAGNRRRRRQESVA